jgi:hypothetical protein
MIELKRIRKEAVPAALQKAERYRLLDDPSAAESICRDALAADPENQQALVMLLLTLTDQFASGSAAELEHRARELLPRITDDYRRAYYEGVVWERRAKAHLLHGAPGAGEAAFEWLQQAMERYEWAERLRPPGNDEAILRWNTCARLLAGDEQHIHPRGEERYEPSYD